MSRTLLAGFVLVGSCAGLWLSMLATSARGDDSKDRVFEIRTYHCLEGRLPALNKRFKEHTCDLFKKHGMELIGFWTPTDEKDGKQDTLVYILAYPSREAAKKSWDAFGADPVWKKAREESEADGKIVAKIESVYLTPTEYSLMK